jgi:two-component system, NarL family, sensor kinase
VLALTGPATDARFPTRLPTWLAATAAATAVLAAVLAGQFVDDQAMPPRVLALPIAIAVMYTAMAILVLRGVPRHPVGLLMAAAGVTASVAVIAASWSGWSPSGWLGRTLLWAPLGLISLALLVFPDGRLPARRWRPLAATIVVVSLVVTVAMSVVAWEEPQEFLVDIYLELSARARFFESVVQFGIVVSGLCLLLVLVSLWIRWRRADGDTRSQLACLLPAGILLVLALVLDAMGITGAFLLAAAVVPAAMTVAVLRYRLYDLDQVINRTVVWLIMTLLVIIAFVTLVAVLRDLFTGDDAASNASLVTTGLIAVTFEPVRQRVQTAVNRLLYGERDDPYRLITRLSDVLGRTVEPNAVLPLLTSTIGRSLRVPYVAVELPGSDGPRRHAEHGAVTASVEAFDMLAHGERVGRLLVATRSAGSRFSTRECRLLEDVALQAAVAAEATRLIRDLQASRERLVVAREEERLRLRRDLHDGLGPSLAGMAMQVRTAHRLGANSPHVEDILRSLGDDLGTCMREVRQLVDQLRPPALDTGLAAALRTECARFDGGTPSVYLQIAGDLDQLPAAVEVAAYRIVAEALTNAVRHAGADTCSVRVERERWLTIDVIDDGVGLPAEPSGRGGVGLESMCTRASELGGECVVENAAPHGTAVRVRLPAPRAGEATAS